LSPSEQKLKEEAMAERLAKYNAKLADEVMAIIIAQMRKESELDGSQDSSLIYPEVSP